MKPYRVTYHSIDDTWCRYFTNHNAAVRFLRQKTENGYTAYLTHVPEL